MNKLSIHQALQKIPWKKAEYFRYKFPDTRFFESEPLTEEQFLKRVGLKTLATFERWEKTAEWKALVALYLESKFANDLIQMHQAVRDKALSGDEKAIKLYLQLGKEIEQIAQQTPVILSVSKKEKEEEDDEDDLIIS